MTGKMSDDTFHVSTSDFDFLCGFFRKRSGYVLEREKEYICASYLSGVMTAAGVGDLAALSRTLRLDPEGPLATAVIEAMTINETMFFRDGQPFVHLAEKILPHLTGGKTSGEVSLLSMACSSGQEPYSMAMILDREKHRYPGWHFSIMAADLCGNILRKAERGVYSDFEISRGLSPDMVNEYMVREGEEWRVHERIRNMVRFRKANLLNIEPSLGVYDVIFCRNVLIYFDPAQKKSVLEKLRQHIRHKGFLFTGVSENVSTIGAKGFTSHPEWRGVYIAA